MRVLDRSPGRTTRLLSVGAQLFRGSAPRACTQAHLKPDPDSLFVACLSELRLVLCRSHSSWAPSSSGDHRGHGATRSFLQYYRVILLNILEPPVGFEPTTCRLRTLVCRKGSAVCEGRTNEAKFVDTVWTQNVVSSPASGQAVLYS
jgi:hypothetical protein